MPRSTSSARVSHRTRRTTPTSWRTRWRGPGRTSFTWSPATRPAPWTRTESRSCASARGTGWLCVCGRPAWACPRWPCASRKVVASRPSSTRARPWKPRITACSLTRRASSRASSTSRPTGKWCRAAGGSMTSTRRKTCRWTGTPGTSTSITATGSNPRTGWNRAR